MNRPWSRVGVRAAAVGLLVAGLLGGVYLGRDRDAKQQTQAQFQNVDVQLLQQRQTEHAADRSRAEGNAADKAAAEAKTVAARARKLETEAIAQKKAAEARKKAAAAKKKAETIGGPVPYTGPIPESCNEFSGARKTGCALMLAAGFKIDQFPCLNKLWNRESGWNYKASNKGSGAYGIPQALPGSKMASAGADWKTNPATQIKWGLGYIKGRYSSPCGAWSHSESVGSY